MNFIKRPIARSRLKKTNEAHRRVEIGIGRAEISVAFDGHKPVRMPADGSTIRWTREDGETFEVNAAWDGERLVQTFKAEDGTRANAFSVGADGRLNMLVTLTSPQLDQPRVHTLTSRGSSLLDSSALIEAVVSYSQCASRRARSVAMVY